MITTLNTAMRTSVYRFVARLALLLTLTVGTLGTASAQTVTYFHNDIAGTPMLATDAAGAVVWKENYLPYGYRQVADPASGGNKLWFTGKAYDPETQLSYMGARYYMPLLGRFTGIDPVEFVPEQPHSFNRYAYANNNPYRYVDPDGRYAIPLLALATVLVVAGNSDAMKPENIALRAKSLSQAGERLSNALNRASNWVFNEGADLPRGDSDVAIEGVKEGLKNELDKKGRPVKGHYVKPGGNAQEDLNSLPGTTGENGQKLLPDGSTAGIHTSHTTGHQTLHIHRPIGSRDVKIRYPENPQ
ncbi:RHS repeat-associated core domain-containing protein [Acidovorax sp. LjRoot117]|uniref:RHS repeat-associated core domain-containing protein n=1 Tax=Acidovorax sp. LjRoot117 TaxID=3342255 RepID=UPI003ECCA3CC